MSRSLYNATHAVRAMTRALRTTGTANGDSIDLGMFGNDFRTVTFVVVTDTITDGTHAFKVQDSPNGSAWADVDSSVIQGTAPTIGSTDDDKVYYFGLLVGGQQYVRLVATSSGTTTGGAFSAVAILGNSSVNPVARS